jgi:hypothetical protein
VIELNVQSFFTENTYSRGDIWLNLLLNSPANL